MPTTKNLAIFFFPSKYPKNQMFRMQKPPQRCLSEGEFAWNNECHAFDRPHHVTGGKGGERWRGGMRSKTLHGFVGIPNCCLLMMSGVFIIL